MMLKTIEVTKFIEINVIDLTNDRSIVHARWKGPKATNEHVAAVVKNEALPLLDSMKSPKDLEALRDSIITGISKYDNHNYVAYPRIIYCEPRDYYDNACSYKEEDKAQIFNFQNDFSKEPEAGYTIIYFGHENHTLYDIDGNLISDRYRDSILNRSYDLHAMISDEEKLSHILEIEKDRFGCKTYYVRGNGETMMVTLKMTPDEYQKFKIDGDHFNVVRPFLRHKLGDDADKYIRAEDLRDDDDN